MRTWGQSNKEINVIAGQSQQQADALVEEERRQQTKETRRMNLIGAHAGDGSIPFFIPNISL